MLALMLGLLAGTAQAYRPANWVWFSWPYAYDLDRATWYYFNQSDNFWTYAPPPGTGWAPLASTNGLSTGWAYFAWPYAYDSEAAYWHYLNEADTQWCLNMTSSEWSRFGVEPPLPPAAPTAYNFDGDARSDFATFERDFALWRILTTNGTTRFHFLGTEESTPVPGDYDGDGITDVAVFVQTTARWLVLSSSNGVEVTTAFGDPDGFPVPGDYDGDRITDLALYYRETGEWQIRSSSNLTVSTFNFGGPLYRPVPADYDGDGKTDRAVYLAASGQWVIVNSGNGAVVTHTLGNLQSIPVPAPYDRDRKADPAIYDPNSSAYWIIQSTTRTLRLALLGGATSVPVPGDYDGDTFADVAVYTPATGRWDYQQSSNLAMRNRTYGLGEYSRAIPAYANGAVEGLRIHCHGDSITYGKSSASDGPSTGYPIRLERNLQGDYGGDIIALNYGVSGETTSKGLERLPGQLDATNARVLLLMEATNDHFFKTGFSTIESNLRAMVQAGLSRGMKVIIATTPPVLASQRPDQAQRIIDFNPRIYQIAQDFGIPVARVYEAITSVSGWENSLMDKSSGNHPNDAGYEYVRKAFYEALVPSLNGAELR